MRGGLRRLSGRQLSAAQSDDVLIARGIGIRYDLNLKTRRTVQESVDDLVHRRRNRRSIWALRDVNFEVAQGESVGVIGRNGAGKSTLMLVLAGILRPDEGSLDVHGRVSALLALGAGFDPDLTGRDNIQLALAFNGIDGAAARMLTPGILDFADLGDFIDAPARTYSTGMRARLGFAVATAFEPDFLVIDEVLSIGDIAFRARSRERIDELVGGAHAAVIVSHDLDYIVESCSKVVWLDKGAVAASGDPRTVVDAYRRASDASEAIMSQPAAANIAAQRDATTGANRQN